MYGMLLQLDFYHQYSSKPAHYYIDMYAQTYHIIVSKQAHITRKT